MKQKLFENIGGNTFKLITESIDEVNPNAKLVRSGLKKVFSAGDKSLSYKRLQGVGLGYIKSVEEAKKTAIQEARELAREYGYMDNENAQAFVKEDENDRIEPDQRWDKVPQTSQPNTHGLEESNDAQIGIKLKRILELSQQSLLSGTNVVILQKSLYEVGKIAQELISMHGQR